VLHTLAQLNPNKQTLNQKELQDSVDGKMSQRPNKCPRSLEQLDDNGDGELPPTQSPNTPKRRPRSMKQLEDNADGKLPPTQSPNSPKRRPRSTKLLEDNADGKLPPTQSPNSPKRVTRSQTAVHDIDQQGTSQSQIISASTHASMTTCDVEVEEECNSSDKSETHDVNSDDDEDYELSCHSENDLYLDADMEVMSEDEDPDGESLYNSVLYHRDAFYKLFQPYYNSVRSSTKLITDKEYNLIKNIISAPKAKKETAVVAKYHRLYSVVGNVERRCLYWQNKVVATYEHTFDVILEAHSMILHARSTKSNLLCITNKLGYYGIPFQAVKMFVSACPLCVPNKTILIRSKQQALKMILSKSAGARFQMDLVEMPEYNEHKYILRVVDHLSKYGYVHPLKRRTATEVGDGLLRILATSLGP
jgi:hypothetical protein